MKIDLIVVFMVKIYEFGVGFLCLVVDLKEFINVRMCFGYCFFSILIVLLKFVLLGWENY